MKRLIDLARRLRDKETGCPWDIKQDFSLFKENILDETKELIAAVESDDPQNLCEEIGDNLWNLAFLINLAEEKNLFDLETVFHGVNRAYRAV